MVYDFLIIGSGFGGAVPALRLAEKGYSVLVIEQGKRYNPPDFAKSNRNLKKYLWAPGMGMYGIQRLSFFKEASILSGVGVGGGSLVYANTLFYPPQKFFQHKNWSQFGNWEKVLEPFYEKAGFMLGRTENPTMNIEDELLRQAAAHLNREHTFKPVQVGVFFDEQKDGTDPYFSGLGPVRNVCTGCAGCMVGCRENAKNTLDKNYLYFAEKFGAKILSEHKARRITFTNKLYSVDTFKVTGLRRRSETFHARNLVVAAGTLGTLELLLKQKKLYKTLPMLSDQLGKNLLTNSETLNAVTVSGKKINNGIAISSGFYVNNETQIEVVKYPDGSNLMKNFFSFAIDGTSGAAGRKLAFFKHILFHPLRFFGFFLRRSWATKTLILLVMQSAENSMSMVLKKGLFGSRMKIRNNNSKKVPAYIPEGQWVMHALAEKAHGTPQNIILETLMNRPTTAHILGGCPMGSDKSTGVVDPRFRVYGYPGMYITDGSVIQGNIGVNPSFTITAQAEYAMSLIPEKSGNRHMALEDQIQKIKDGHNRP